MFYPFNSTFISTYNTI